MSEYGLYWREIENLSQALIYGRNLARKKYALPSENIRHETVICDTDRVPILAYTDNRLSGEVIVLQRFLPGPNEILFQLPTVHVASGENFQKEVENGLVELTGYQSTVHLLQSFFTESHNTSRCIPGVARNCRVVKTFVPDPLNPMLIKLLSIKELKSAVQKGLLVDPAAALFALEF